MLDSNVSLFDAFSYCPNSGLIRWKIDHTRGIKVGDVAGNKNGKGYLRFQFQGKFYQAHRVAWLLYYGQYPSQWIDHINGDPTDNRICNLRQATPSQNALNRRASVGSSSSGAVGVCWHRRLKKWQVMVCGQYLGIFASRQAAIKTVIAYRRKHYPEFSQTVCNRLEVLAEGAAL